MQVKGHAGNVLAGRYRLLERIASGGMGTVHRALDEATNRVVAVKVVSTGTGSMELVERFRREARILADLTHPGVVGFVDFGAVDEGAHYLVMEWLEGHDLAERLREGVLGVRDALQIARQVADALGAAHGLGIVHRDIKPANVFLVGGRCDRVKVLDFGIALVTGASIGITRTGMTVGTPEYMPPEQARGERSMDARVDIYALGCVLYQCLSGKPPFFGPTAAAVIADLLLTDPPRLSSRVTEVPPELDDLVASMLAKDASKRPASAAEVADSLGRMVTDLHTRPAPIRAAVSTDERRLATLLGVRDATSERAAIVVGEVAARYGTSPIALPDGSAVMVFVSESAIQAALTAAQAARELVEADDSLALSLMAGQTSVRSGPDQGFVLRAIELASMRGVIRVNEAARSLIGGALNVQPTPAGPVLRGERRPEPTATSALVGREREVTALFGALEAVVADRVPQLVIVTASPGMGKSRLARELFDRAKSLPHRLAILEARAEELRRGTPYAALGALLRRGLGVAESAPVQDQRVALAQSLGPIDDAQARTALEFAGLVAGIEPEQPSVELVAALRDPQLMHDQIERSMASLFSLLAARVGGLALILDDAHLADAATLKVLARVHRRATEGPVFFGLFGRPELRERAPAGLFEAASQWVQLGGLSRRAAERVVQGALGDQAGPETVERIVAHAEGNPLFLHELCAARLDCEIATPAVPPNVLASVEARLLRLEPSARKILRAASVFGDTFWQGGVARLLGPGSIETQSLGDWLVQLVDRGILVPRRETRFAGEPELAFHHPLLREAAYGMLATEDREEGHRRAAEWLLHAGERHSAVVGEHLSAAGSGDLAAGFFLEAASVSLMRNDLSHAVEHAERAIGAGLDDARRARAHTILCEAFHWLSEQERGAEHGRAALSLAAPATQAWMDAASALVRCLARKGDLELLDVARDLVRAARRGEALMPNPAALPDIVATALRAGLRALADDLLDVFGPRLAQAEDPVGRAHILTCRSWLAMFDGDYAACIAYDTEVLRCMTEAGDLRQAALARVHVGYDNLILGVYQRAAEELTAAQEEAEQLGVDAVEQMAKHNLALALHRLGESDRGLELQRECLAHALGSHNALEEGHARHYLGIMLFERGELEASKIELERVLGAMPTPALRWETLARLAAIALQRGDLEEARYKIEEARMGLDQLKNAEEGDALIRLVSVQVERACGDEQKAAELLVAARNRILWRAGRIADPVLRRSFMRALPEHAATLDLAERLAAAGRSR